MKDWQQTFTGRQFYPLRPRASQIHIVDIAHALASAHRYVGHTTRPYSVGEHSCHVSRQLLLETGNQQLALAGLLHDASEAYTNDMARPLKTQPAMKPFRELEADIQQYIYTKYALPDVEDPRVKVADMRMYATEVRDLMQPQHPAWIVTEEPYGFKVDIPWSFHHTRATFLSMFDQLGGRENVQRQTDVQLWESVPHITPPRRPPEAVRVDRWDNLERRFCGTPGYGFFGRALLRR